MPSSRLPSQALLPRGPSIYDPSLMSSRPDQAAWNYSTASSGYTSFPDMSTPTMQQLGPVYNPYAVNRGTPQLPSVMPSSTRSTTSAQSSSQPAIPATDSTAVDTVTRLETNAQLDDTVITEQSGAESTREAENEDQVVPSLSWDHLVNLPGEPSFDDSQM